MNTAQLAIQHYILAKDGNRPHLLNRAFVPEATLDMVVRTGSISFPPHVEGVGGIGDVLVRRFGRTFENVYTFCLGQPPEAGAKTYQCKWLVGMSDKNTGEARVGCGVYEWQFSAESGLVEKLTITIEHMKTLPAADLAGVMEWVSGLNYPWCSLEAAVSTAPQSVAVNEVTQFLTAQMPRF
ncbi:hypothetical protein RGV33_19755 [Pseudomonas sp. Bout1]|uniref:hypothetical protein n=1 Tax=Pseudomonas sp. Bout1 TaxID=3048600 RepID=UPI002AB4AC36|nr:hypothetical protein [Pseudomonas sp. Bout1]MDY7533895.1 hypothetical protein [Pseudomonas sp. Bout1]MEB0188443.1 hypothetical protein [Pseudomonas sp. Bout1]